LQYKLIGKNNILQPIQTVLLNRNITIELFSLTESVIEDYNNYDHMIAGINLLLKHLNNKSKIAMVVDSDFDGKASFTIIYRRIKKLFPDANIQILIHTEKQHGLSSDIHIEDDINLVILTDSSSNDFKQHKELKNKGIDVLVIDHHLCDDGYSPYAVVINNQLSDKVKNKNGCGAFVCYKFLKALDDYIFDDVTDEYEDLVAFANVADVMDLKEKESRYFVYQGINNINNNFLKALIEENSYNLGGKVNITKIGWNISPLINASIRSGTQEEKMQVVQAFISDDYNFCLKVAKMCKNIKARQDRAVKSALKKIESKLEIAKEDRCIIIDVGNTLSKSHTGLVAGKIADKYKLPALLYRKVDNKENFVGGSFRGINSISEDLRIDILNSGLVEFSEGHELAGGYQLNKNKINNLKEYLNDLYKDKKVINSKMYQVDFILNEKNLNNDIIYELAQYEDEWGNGISEPLLAFENITINITNDNIKGKRAKNLVFNVNDVKFIKKYLSNNLTSQVLDKSDIKVTIIGKVANNIYNGNTYPQIEIVDIEIN
jgi:single-stranded-DNA-specific exonuclease